MKSIQKGGYDEEMVEELGQGEPPNHRCIHYWRPNRYSSRHGSVWRMTTRTAYWLTACVVAFFAGLVIGTAQIPIAFAAKHIKKPLHCAY